MTAERILNGRYEVRELIGRGGMADVHLGRDIRLGRAVAIKVLRRDLARDPLFQSRFRREAQAVAGLNNPNIVAVYDTGEEEIPDRPEHEVLVPFIVMEYVAGRTLRELVKSGDLSIEDSLKHLAGVLSALAYSHRAGIVHRDIKPANVMITPEGTVKVMDFGIARAIADSAATMTQTQAVVGTAQYLSPEQARGETVDARSDLYSAGCLLYELLAGRPPFIGDSPVSVAYQHVREEPLPASSFNPEITPTLDSVLAKALAKDREDRFQDADSFRTALEAAGRGVAYYDGDSSPTQALDTLKTRAAPVLGGAVPAADDQDAPSTRMLTKISDESGHGGHGPGEDNALLPAGLGKEQAKEAEPRRKSGRGAWLAVFLVAVLLVLGAGFAILYNLGQSRPEAAPVVEVPQVAGLTETKGFGLLYDADLMPLAEEQFNATVEAGLIVSSDPAAGALVEPDSRVVVIVSKGPANVPVPETIKGMTESSARDALEVVGLKGGEITEVTSAQVPEGRVISSDPQPGTSVPVDSPVNLVLSNGKVKVPSLSGLTQAAAEALLKDPAVALPYRIEPVENSVLEPGLVTRQSEKAGSEVEQGTEIVIQIAVAPKPEAPAEPSSEPSPEPTASATTKEP